MRRSQVSGIAEGNAAEARGRRTSIVFGVAVLTAFAGSASANLIVNGSFETDGFLVASPTLTGWTVDYGNIDAVPGLVGGSTATDGLYLIDLEGVLAAQITQVVPGLVIGNSYTLSFDLGANTSNTDLGLALSGAASLSEIIPASTGPLVTQVRTFVATSPTLTLSFTDAGGTGGNAGPALDNVSLIPAPGAAALLGLGGLLAARGRR